MRNIATSIAHRLDTAEFLIDHQNDIVHAHLLSDDFCNLQKVEEFFSALEELTQNQKINLVIHNLSVGLTSAEVRRVIQYRARPLVNKAAVIAPNHLFQMLFFMLRFISGSSAVQYQLFTNEDDAVEWLLEK